MFREVTEYTLDEPTPGAPPDGMDIPGEMPQEPVQDLSEGKAGRYREVTDYTLDALPEPPKESVAKRLGRTAKQFGKQTLGLAEAGAEFGGGMVSFMNPIPGIAAIGKEKFDEGEFETMGMGSPLGASFEPLDTEYAKSWEEATANIQNAQKIMEPYLVHSAKTEEGKGYSEKLHSFMNWLITNPSETAGNLALETLAPVIGAEKAAVVATAIKSTAEIGGYMALFGGGHKLKGKGVEKPKITEKGIREFEEHMTTEAGIKAMVDTIERKALPSGPLEMPGKVEAPFTEAEMFQRYRGAEGVDSPYKRLPETPESRKALERGALEMPEGEIAPVDPTVARYREVALKDIKLDKEPKALKRGALEMPEGEIAPKKVPRETPEAVAKFLDIKYDGIQEGAEGTPGLYQFTTKDTGHTFYVEDLGKVESKLREKRTEIKAGEPKEQKPWARMKPDKSLEKLGKVSKAKEAPKKEPHFQTLKLSESEKATLKTVGEEVGAGQAGGRTFKDNIGSGQTVGGYGSSFPEYFRDKGYTKKETLKAIDKAMKGEPLGPKQRMIVEDLNNSYRSDLATEGRDYRLEVQEQRKAKAKAKTEEMFPVERQAPEGKIRESDLETGFEAMERQMREVEAEGKQGRLISKEAYEKAQKSIKKKTGKTTLRAGVDPTILKDMVVVAAYHIESGARGFVKFSEDMIKEYGEKARPYLTKAWKEARKQIREKKITVPEKVKKEPTGVATTDKYARSVNLDKLNIPEEHKGLLRKAGGKRDKKKQTWDETGELSEQILEDYKKMGKVLQKAKKGDALTAVELDAVRQVEVNAIDRLTEISKTKTREEFNKDFSKFEDDIFTAVSTASSEAGRALNTLRKEVSVRRIGKAFSELKRELNPREFKEFKELNFDNPLEVQRFVDRLGDPKLIDYVYEYWYNSILSGIPTHVVNVTSNTAWGLFQVPHRGLVGAVDLGLSKLTGRQREVYAQEVVPYFAGFTKGFKRGGGRAVEVVKTGKEPLDLSSKWDRDIGSSTLSAFERSPNAALRKAAPYITAPTRALRAMDVWFNTAAMDAELMALARRKALQSGKKGEALKKMERELLEKPTEEMLQDAAIQAKYSTFMDEPGKFTSWILKGREAIPGSRFVVPFVNTISNLMKRGVEMTPGVGLALAKGKKPAEVLAKQVEGAILSLYILHKVDQGDITGRVPKNKAEREAFYKEGKKPWSIRFGDTWIQYRRMEPFNTVIASVAIAYDTIKGADSEDTATGIFLDTAAGVTENLLDSHYLQGVTNITDKYGTKRKGMVQRLAASFVPYSSFWRSINRSYEVATEGSTKVRDTKSLAGAFSQVIPGLSGLAKPRLNVWGKEIEMQGGIFRQWLPYKWSTETKDKVDIELGRLEIYPAIPGKVVTIRGEKEELSEGDHRNYVVAYGAEAYQEMKTIMNRANYKTMPDERKVKFLDKRLSSIRKRHLSRVKREHTKARLNQRRK